MNEFPMSPSLYDGFAAEYRRMGSPRSGNPSDEMSCNRWVVADEQPILLVVGPLVAMPDIGVAPLGLVFAEPYVSME